MKILPINSKIRYPLINLDSRQVVFFNAIRYSSDICEISYNRLINNLLNLTEKGSVNSEDFPNIYSDTWSIINNASIFKKLIKTEFAPINVESNFPEINKAIELRNSNQHLDERLDEIHKNDFPIYGSISWTKKIPPNEFITSISYSGTFTNKENINSNVRNQNIDELDEAIHKLEFTGITRKGNKPNFTFQTESVYIVKIIKEMILHIEHLEKLINEQMQEFENISHNSDLLFQFKGFEIG
jgi:hypothetical protein